MTVTPLESSSPASLEGSPKVSTLTLGNLTLNLNTYQAEVEGIPIELSYSEFELLCLLASEHDRVLSYEAIVEAIWKESGHGSVRHLHVVAHRVRHKLAGLQSYEIRTVRGRGYGLVQIRGPR